MEDKIKAITCLAGDGLYRRLCVRLVPTSVRQWAYLFKGRVQLLNVTNRSGNYQYHDIVDTQSKVGT